MCPVFYFSTNISMPVYFLFSLLQVRVGSGALFLFQNIISCIFFVFTNTYFFPFLKVPLVVQQILQCDH
jgi:hypothetical protein